LNVSVENVGKIKTEKNEQGKKQLHICITLAIIDSEGLTVSIPNPLERKQGQVLILTVPATSSRTNWPWLAIWVLMLLLLLLLRCCSDHLTIDALTLLTILLHKILSPVSAGASSPFHLSSFLFARRPPPSIPNSSASIRAPREASPDPDYV
jgi:hypothetical protein